MAYTKSDWTVGETIDETRLDHAETQYDEVIADLAAGTLNEIIAGSTLAAGADVKSAGYFVIRNGYPNFIRATMFSARNSLNGNTNPGVETDVIIASEDWDPRNLYDDSYGVFYPDKPGYYLINAAYTIEASAAGKARLGLYIDYTLKFSDLASWNAPAAGSDPHDITLKISKIAYIGPGAPVKLTIKNLGDNSFTRSTERAADAIAWFEAVYLGG